jgi:glycosyltransferase involved in cell wall biosynthesis
MITNRDIIIFSGDWNIFPSTLQHVGRVLATSNRILWIAGLGHRKPKFQLYDFKRIVVKGTRMLTQGFVKDNSVPVIETHPFVLPYYDTAVVRRFNDRSLRNHLLKKIDELQFQNPIVIVSNPVAAGVIGRLGESSSHYFCVDDYSHFKDSFRSVKMMEQEVLEKVDSCFAVSDALVQTRKPLNGKSYFFPQGVDTVHFRPLNNTLPEKITSIQKPIVGFFGMIAPWIDLELIVHCARQYPSVSFVIIGRTSTDITLLSRAKNIYYLGEVPYSELPLYAQVFDVGIVPFIINDLTIPSNPLKLLEYIAMGIPVVSTNLPEAKKFSDCVYIAQDSNQFIDLIGAALKEQSKEKRKQRVELVQRYSWNAIVEDISKIILSIEKQKQNPHGLKTKAVSA